MGYFDKAAKPM